VDEVVVIGVGNPDRGDDAAGPAVVAALRGRLPPRIRLATTVGSDPATFWSLWEGAERVVVVDAMVSGRPSGTVARFDVSNDPLPGSVRLVSTHAMGAPAAIELARATGRLPHRISVHGIEGGLFTAGAAMSEEVVRAVSEVAGALVDEVLESVEGDGVATEGEVA
jgi:hydrogenase maturation protease